MELCKCFTRTYVEIAKSLTRTTLASTCCRIAAERIVYTALKLRKDSAGNFLDFPVDGFGVSYHTSPYFYDTADIPFA